MSSRFVVGDVDKPMSQRLHANGIAHDYGEYIAPGTEVTLKSPIEGTTKWSVTGVKDYTVDPETQALSFIMPTNPVQVEAAKVMEEPKGLPSWALALISVFAALTAIGIAVFSQFPVVEQLRKLLNF